MALSTYRQILQRRHQDADPQDTAAHHPPPPYPTHHNHRSHPQDPGSLPARAASKLPPKLSHMLGKPPFHKAPLNPPSAPTTSSSPPASPAPPRRRSGSRDGLCAVPTPSASSSPVAAGPKTNANTTPSSSSSSSSSATTVHTLTPSSPSSPLPSPLAFPSAPGTHVVILGGSFSGLSVCVALSRLSARDRGGPSALKVTLVEPKAYLEVRWATIRSLFDARVAASSTVPLRKVLSEHSSTVTHVRGRGRAVFLDSVELEDGRHIPYDVLLVATGAVTSYAPLTPHLTPPPAASASADDYDDELSKRRAFLAEAGNQLLSARAVAVVGGGPVGSELAADIAAFARERQAPTRVTLVDSHDKLMPGYPRSVATRLREKLSSLGVHVVLGHIARPVPGSVQLASGGGANTSKKSAGGILTSGEEWELFPSPNFEVSTTSGNVNVDAKLNALGKNGHSSNNNAHGHGHGRRLDVDIVITATGVRPAERRLFGPGQVGGTESAHDGWIRTDRFGRVIGCRGDVFAAGDCCDWKAKSGENTLSNRHAYAHNIRATCDAIANNRALASIDSKLKRVSMSHRPPAVVVSNPCGDRGSAGVAGGGGLLDKQSSPLAALSPAWWWMKNRGMVLAKAQKEIGW